MKDAEVIMAFLKKKKFIITFVVVCFGFAVSIFAASEYYSGKYAENILRFHVIANSNTAEDQALKLKVRDAVGCRISELSKNAADAKETAEIVARHSVDIIKTAEDCIKKEGYEYKVSIEIGEFYFPTKYYSGMSLPAGDYEAVRIVIGSGSGENWWCVLFPPLCFSDGNAVTVSGKSDNQTHEKVTVKFKFVELFQEIKHDFQKLHQKIFK